ncbi:MAG: hypothetical protein HN742_00120 [Lentisphaerae bacterium]|jgi:hypothetical protein|nr:hypothetical protein [Lentisphaerota bacterium]MBT4816881.1 hypothetical protein [Lentisphaerota bacterium]MBT5608087.1 hypothetical protein [Lentisphaerota bacterium]MBT7057607.1 hypothetical protein [Lentisphaerota bacterium]MBT7840234.1 hypothetical protein [Lentisphaerota bacterium]
MAYRGTYRTKSGRNRFRFAFEKQPDGDVRAYIENQPSYEGRATDGHSTHRYSDGSRRYVCYDPMPDNLDDAIEVAKAWADHTEEYVRTGRRF